MEMNSLTKILKSDKGDKKQIRPFLLETLDLASFPFYDRDRSDGHLNGKFEEIERQAYEEGFCSGEKAGLEMGQKKMEVLIDRFSNIMQELGTLKKTILESMEENILDLSLLIAEKVVHQEVKAEKDLVLTVVKAALDAAVVSEKINIRLNPSDLEVVTKSKPELQEQLKGSPILKIVKDEGVEPGGCIIETAFGNVDARLDEQMAEIEKALKEELKVES